MITPQLPAEGISLNKELPNYKSYSVPCSCGNPDDDISFSVESEDWGEITVTTYTLQKTSWWDDPFNQHKSYDIDNEWAYRINYWIRGVLNGLSHRLKVTWEVWVKGYVKYSQNTIMTKQQALNYAATLKHAVEDLEEFSRLSNKKIKDLNVKD